jgi:nitrate reductase NapE component
LSPAGGVELAIEELTKDSNTKDRTAIVVFTDGQDDSPGDLVTQVERATQLGIRVSFGFLSLTTGLQDADILNAVRASRGIYATIADASGATNYVKYAILNGLTYNDNPQGFDQRLLSGLAQTYTISGSGSITLKYRADRGESVTFTVTSISAGPLKAVAKMGGSTLAEGNTGSSFSFSSIGDTVDLALAAPRDGDIEVQIKADSAPPDSLLSVLTLSDVPIKNCTIGVKKQGLTAGAKAGAAVGTILGVAVLGTCGFLVWKYLHPATPPGYYPGMDSMSQPLAKGCVEPIPSIPAAPPGAPPAMAVPPPIPPPSNPTQPRAGNEDMYNQQPRQQEYPPLGQQPADSLSNPPQPAQPAQPYQPYQPSYPYGGDPSNYPGQQPPTDPTQQYPYDPSHQPPTDPSQQPPQDPQQPPQDPQQPPQDPQQPPQDPQQPPQDPQQPLQDDLPNPPDRLPKIKRGIIEKHHHHHYLQPEEECLAEHCEYNQEHTCLPDEDTCPCTCRDPKCPVTKERERIQRDRDALHTLLANIA